MSVISFQHCSYKKLSLLWKFMVLMKVCGTFVIAPTRPHRRPNPWKPSPAHNFSVSLWLFAAILGQFVSVSHQCSNTAGNYGSFAAVDGYVVCVHFRSHPSPGTAHPFPGTAHPSPGTAHPLPAPCHRPLVPCLLPPTTRPLPPPTCPRSWRSLRSLASCASTRSRMRRSLSWSAPIWGGGT